MSVKFAIYRAKMIAQNATDIEERILPDEFTIGGTIVGIVLAYFVPVEDGFARFLLPITVKEGWRSMADAAIAAGVASGSIWFVGWAYEKIRHREGLGLGDVKMIAMIGAFLGLRWALATLILASLLGSVIGRSLLTCSGATATSGATPVPAVPLAESTM